MGLARRRERRPLPKAAAAPLRGELGAGAARAAAPALERIALPEPALPARARAQLVAAVGADHVRDDRLARVADATGRS